MEKKGQVIFYGLMLAIVIIVLALALSGPVKEQTDNARNNTDLNCSNSSISDFNKVACITTDLTLFYFVGGLIFIGGLVAVSKIIFT